MAFLCSELGPTDVDARLHLSHHWYQIRCDVKSHAHAHTAQRVSSDGSTTYDAIRIRPQRGLDPFTLDQNWDTLQLIAVAVDSGRSRLSDG